MGLPLTSRTCTIRCTGCAAALPIGLPAEGCTGGACAKPEADSKRQPAAPIRVVARDVMTRNAIFNPCCGRETWTCAVSYTDGSEKRVRQLLRGDPASRVRLIGPGIQSAASAPCKPNPGRSEEHTSELQSRRDLVCRLLLEKKKNE